MRLRPIRSAAAFCTLVILAGGRADASIIGAVYDLTDFNRTNDVVSAPYEVVKLTGNTTAGTVTFDVSMTSADVASGGAKFSEFGLSASSLLSGLTAANFISVTPADFSVTGGSTALGGYGKFNWILDAPNTAADRTTSLSFTITGINALVGNSNWTLTSHTGSTEILFATSKNGNLFVSNYVPSSGDEGFVSQPAFDGAPEPSTALLLGLGTVGLFGFAFRRRWVQS
jgi:hypothetical protein